MKVLEIGLSIYTIVPIGILGISVAESSWTYSAAFPAAFVVLARCFCPGAAGLFISPLERSVKTMGKVTLEPDENYLNRLIENHYKLLDVAHA